MGRQEMIAHLILHGWEPGEVLKGKKTGFRCAGLVDQEGRFLFYSPKYRTLKYSTMQDQKWPRPRREWRVITTVQLEEFISFLNEEVLHGQNT